MKSEGSRNSLTLSDMTCKIPKKPSTSYFLRIAFLLAGSDSDLLHCGNFSQWHDVYSCAMLNSGKSLSEKTVISAHTELAINTCTVFLTSGRRRSSKRRIAIFLSVILLGYGYVFVLKNYLVRFSLFALNILLHYIRHGKYSRLRPDPAQINPNFQVIF